MAWLMSSSASLIPKSSATCSQSRKSRVSSRLRMEPPKYKSFGRRPANLHLIDLARIVFFAVQGHQRRDAPAVGDPIGDFREEVPTTHRAAGEHEREHADDRQDSEHRFAVTPKVVKGIESHWRSSLY